MGHVEFQPFEREQPPQTFVDIVHKRETIELQLISDQTGDEYLELTINVDLRWNPDTTCIDWEPVEYFLGDQKYDVQSIYGNLNGPIRNDVIKDICAQRMTAEHLNKLIDEDNAFAFVRAAHARNKAAARSLYQRERI